MNTFHCSNEGMNKYDTSYTTVGGSHISVFIDFQDTIKNSEGQYENPWIYAGSISTVSYSVYREKNSVYHLGRSIVDGISIGNKTLAGSIVKVSMSNDEMQNQLNKIKKSAEKFPSLRRINERSYSEDSSSMMLDDLTSFNIVLVSSSEFNGDIFIEIIYGCNIISNGQVSSAMDLITEKTISFIAKDIKTMGSVSNFSEETVYLKNPMFGVKKASDLLK